MSFQRVIETARKTGVPVILTDVAGREPMVILSLEQFEAMASEGGSDASARRSRPVRTESAEKVLAEIAEERKKERIQEVTEELKALSKNGIDAAEISLEERFYIEPVDDKA